MAMLVNPFSVIPGFAPDDVSGLVLWLDAQDGSTITIGAGGVSDWDDKSGSGLTFSQPTAGRQPDWITVSGRLMLSFDGTDDYISHADNSRFDFAGDFEIHVVYRTADVNRGALITKGSSVRYHIRVNNADTNNGDLVCDIDDNTTAATVVDTSQNYNDDVVRMVTMVRDGNNLRQFEDGTETGPSPTDITGYGSLENGGIVFVGSFDSSLQFLDGEIGEILIYDNAISSGDRADVFSYLKSKWGIS